jgi:DDE family transposase
MSFSTTRSATAQLDNILAPFCQADGLPFAEVLTADTIARAFDDDQVSFGQKAHSFWTPALTLWTFLSQVLDDGSKSCRAAVARAVVAMALTQPPAEYDTGNYCRARAKLPTSVLCRLTLQVAVVLEKEAPAEWLWRGRHVFLVDGFTASMPDTEENQKAYPQPNTQKPGLGFPLIRLVVLLSLATAACHGLDWAPYQGKETGEPALFRTLLDHLEPGAIVLGDRVYCSFFMLALLLSQDVDVVTRLHQFRTNPFRLSRHVDRDDRLVIWSKPEQPDWMDNETYAAMPETIQVRYLYQRITIPGFRVQHLHVVTTLLDAEAHAHEDIVDLYHRRWHVELDIRSIKSTLKMDVLRCLTPFMIEKEIWAHFLGYNLIRKVAAQAALLRGVCPREISFAASQQTVLGAWSKLTEARVTERAEIARALLLALGKEKVGHRPNRCEPRAIKRRPKKQKLLMKPRKQAKADLLAGRGVDVK